MCPPSNDDDWQPHLQGLWFEDFEPGRTFRTARRTVTEADIGAFAGLSGDFNPIHTDEVFAASGPLRGRVAHGMLIMSIATGLAVQTGIFQGSLVALAGMEIQWDRPVRAGDTLGVELVVSERAAEPGPKRGPVRFDVNVLNQTGKVVTQAGWRTVVARRPLG